MAIFPFFDRVLDNAHTRYIILNPILMSVNRMKCCLHVEGLLFCLTISFSERLRILGFKLLRGSKHIAILPL